MIGARRLLRSRSESLRCLTYSRFCLFHVAFAFHLTDIFTLTLSMSVSCALALLCNVSSIALSCNSFYNVYSSYCINILYYSLQRNDVQKDASRRVCIYVWHYLFLPRPLARTRRAATPFFSTYHDDTLIVIHPATIFLCDTTSSQQRCSINSSGCGWRYVQLVASFLGTGNFVFPSKFPKIIASHTAVLLLDAPLPLTTLVMHALVVRTPSGQARSQRLKLVY